MYSSIDACRYMGDLIELYCTAFYCIVMLYVVLATRIIGRRYNQGMMTLFVDMILFVYLCVVSAYDICHVHMYRIWSVPACTCTVV